MPCLLSYLVGFSCFQLIIRQIDLDWHLPSVKKICNGYAFKKSSLHLAKICKLHQLVELVSAYLIYIQNYLSYLALFDTGPRDL